MKKILALSLAALMLLGMLVACGKPVDQPDGETTTAAADSTPETESKYDEQGYLKDDIPASVNFNNAKINILYWSDVERPEFEVEEQTGDLFLDALWTRNLHVEERLGVTLNWIGTPGNYGNRGSFLNKIETDLNGDSEYQMYAGYSLYASTATIRGYHRDLSSLDALNFSQPWWPASFLEMGTINDKIYFCTGDVSANTIYMMYCTYFTKEIANQYNITGLYELARNGEWTIDKMMEIASVCYIDLNGDQKKDYASDQFGFMTADLHFDCFFNGSGLRALERDDEGKLILSPSFGSEKTQNLIGKLIGYFDQEYCDVTATSSTNVDVTALSQGRVLFNVNRCYIPTWGVMQNVSYTYGILPVPKYDIDQQDYITTMANPHTQYALSYGLKDDEAEMLATVLECMASESYRNVSPALFELTMKLKYATEQEDSEMYDIIRRTVAVDLGRLFSEDFGSVTQNLFRNTVKNKSTAWVTGFKQQSKVLGNMLVTVNEALEKVSEAN